MITPGNLAPRLHRLSLPGALLLALLQRTPALRALATGAEFAAASPAGQVMRSIFAPAALGATHALAGATAFIINPRPPIAATVGTAIPTIAFTYTGTPAPPASFRVTGSLPPGLSFSPAPFFGTIPSGTPVITGTPTQAGTFTVFVQGFSGEGNTNNVQQLIQFNVTGSGPPPVAPAFSTQPASQTVPAGATVSFVATATGTPAPTFQWRRDGTNLAGATSATLTLPNVQAADAGAYAVVASNSAGSVTSATATLTVIGSRLVNLSVRTSLAAGNILIVGVVVDGGTRDILVRAAGPALAAFGLTAAMVDPRLDLFTGQTVVFSNDNWPPNLSATFAAVGAFAFPNDSRDAAFVQRMNSAYSIQAQGTGPGVVLVEAYDTGAPAAARLVNVSARNLVGTGDDILIAGFTIAGTGVKSLLLRAVGPKLGAFGVSGFLADPVLEVFNDAQIKVAENDNWAPALAATFASVGAFALDNDSRDAALRAELPPGSYTAQVRGANNGTGEALIEIYEVR